jgi:hypothetical protein
MCRANDGRSENLSKHRLGSKFPGFNSSSNGVDDLLRERQILFRRWSSCISCSVHGIMITVWNNINTCDSFYSAQTWCYTHPPSRLATRHLCGTYHINNNNNNLLIPDNRVAHFNKLIDKDSPRAIRSAACTPAGDNVYKYCT